MATKDQKNELLRRAVSENDAASCQRLLNEGADPNWRSADSYSALMRAARENHLTLVRVLIDHGADINFAADDGRCSLTVTSDTRIVQHLIDLGAILSPDLAVQLMNSFDGNNLIRELLSARGASWEGWQDSPRQLYSRIIGYDGASLALDVLSPSIEAMREIIAKLVTHKEYRADEKASMQQIDLWELYAFSRINDALLMSFQPDTMSLSQAAPPLSREDYIGFFEALGFSSFEHHKFHPFFHEIVVVDNKVCDDSRPEIIDLIWPGLRFGSLIFSRQGVAIRSGKNIVDKEITKASTMHFTYERRSRQTIDESQGWGSESQWRTAVRRDYEDDNYYYYNIGQSIIIDADIRTADIDYDKTGLSAEELIELIRFRHFVHATKDSSDVYPYKYSVREKKPDKNAVDQFFTANLYK